MNFWSFFTRPGDKNDEKINNCPQVAQAHYESPEQHYPT